MDHPYKGLNARAFWKRSVGDRHFFDICDLATPKWKLSRSDAIATAGSCFAQHIARRLRADGFKFLDLEPAPPMLRAEDHQRFGYGLFSARYGNVYTSRQFLQLFQRAFSRFLPAETVWESDGRFLTHSGPASSPTASPPATRYCRPKRGTSSQSGDCSKRLTSLSSRWG